MIKKILLFIFIIACSHSYSQEIEFYKENITMEISDGHFHVTGNYYLRSDTVSPFPLTYPFPKDPLYGEVDSVNLFNLKTGQAIEIKKKTISGILFMAEPDSTGKVETLISYRQKLKGKKAEYIVITTRNWQQPLEEATFQLITPSDMVMEHFSYLPSDTLVTQKNTVYTWQMFNFMPERNMVFEW